MRGCFGRLSRRLWCGGPAVWPLLCCCVAVSLLMVAWSLLCGFRSDVSLRLLHEDSCTERALWLVGRLAGPPETCVDVTFEATRPAYGDSEVSTRSLWQSW